MRSVNVKLSSSPREAAALSSCDFCRHLSGVTDRRLNWEVVAQTPEFVVVPSIGSLVPGWVLVVPRAHTLNLAELSDRTAVRLDEFLRPFLRAWTAAFGRCIEFEHGPARAGAAVGCSVDHAHLHIVPVGEVDLATDARRLLSGVSFREVQDIRAASRSAVAEGLDYLSVRASTGVQLVASGTEIPSQALRRVIASGLDRSDEWNWRTHPQEPVVRETLRRSPRLRGGLIGQR